MKLAKCSIVILQWTLGLVVLIEAGLLAFSSPEIRSFHKAGLPDAVRLVLAWGEILGAVVFLIPRTVVLGGWILIVVFLAASGVHLLHGMWNVGMLLIYVAAAYAVMTNRAVRA